jgi:hypothetical protein
MMTPDIRSPSKLKTVIGAWNSVIVLALCFYGSLAYIPIDTQSENAPELASKQGVSLDNLTLA